MKAINTTTWVRDGRIRAKRRLFATANAAHESAQRDTTAGRRVAYSMIWGRDPISGERYRVFVVTTRPAPLWEKFAEAKTGYGH